MARVSARGSGVCPFRTKRGSSGVGVSLVLQGHDSGGEKECGRTARKACLNGTFSSRFVRVLYSQSRAGRGLAFGGARRLCVRMRFHRDGGCGDLSIGGGRISGPALAISRGAGSVLRCTSWQNCAARCRPKKRGACLRNPKARNGDASPEGVEFLLQMRRPSWAVRSWGYRIWQLLYCSRMRAFAVLLFSRRTPLRENGRRYYAV